jgi:hypothetical protein
VLSCVGRDFALDWFPNQGVLPNVYRIEKSIKEGIGRQKTAESHGGGGGNRGDGKTKDSEMNGNKQFPNSVSSWQQKSDNTERNYEIMSKEM